MESLEKKEENWGKTLNRLVLVGAFAGAIGGAFLGSFTKPHLEKFIDYVGSYIAKVQQDNSYSE